MRRWTTVPGQGQRLCAPVSQRRFSHGPPSLKYSRVSGPGFTEIHLFHVLNLCSKNELAAPVDLGRARPRIAD